jgi:hypothetical protein
MNTAQAEALSCTIGRCAAGWANIVDAQLCVTLAEDLPEHGARLFDAANAIFDGDHARAAQLLGDLSCNSAA